MNKIKVTQPISIFLVVVILFEWGGTSNDAQNLFLTLYSVITLGGAYRTWMKPRSATCKASPLSTVV